jgi:hypothetical protein
MATIKSYSDLQQSKKLAEILPLESADFCYIKTGVTRDNWMGIPEYQFKPMPHKDYSGESIGCWSLAALRNLLPPAIKPNKDSYLFESHNTFDNSWVYRYYNEDGASYLYCKNTNEVDACVDMIVGLGERNLL